MFISRYKSSLFPGNVETLTILNNSPMIVEAFFCFQNDVRASTYFLEPMNMTLKPNEKQVQLPGSESARVGPSRELSDLGLSAQMCFSLDSSVRY